MRSLYLGADDVHAWCLNLTAAAHEASRLWAHLAPDEQRRARRLRCEKHRGRFIICRGVLRELLALYSRTSPQEVCFQYAAYGKPSLVQSTTDVRFNISHSEDVALLVFACRRDVGIDVEWMKRDIDVDDIANRFFSRAEIGDLADTPLECRRAAFFHCWTCKEAYIKARGEGLSHPLSQFDVSVDPRRPAKLCVTRPDPDEAARWSLRGLNIAEDYAAAMVVEGHTWSLDFRRWKTP